MGEHAEAVRLADYVIELHLIPGPDPGACPDCGGWMKAGMTHNCDVHREQMAKNAQEMLELMADLTTLRGSEGDTA